MVQHLKMSENWKSKVHFTHHPKISCGTDCLPLGHIYAVLEVGIEALEQRKHVNKQLKLQQMIFPKRKGKW